MKKQITRTLEFLAKKQKRTFSLEFLQLLSTYKNDPTLHQSIWERFYRGTDSILWMKEHRDFIEKNGFGYGDRPFHYEWKLLVEQMPATFSFLEIGVFKGQVLSLVQLLSDKLLRQPTIVGVTPLTGDGDHYFTHPELDYLKAIKTLYKKFNLDFGNTSIIKGFSQAEKVVKKVNTKGPFDMVFIDGSHDYEIVVADIHNYSKLVKVGGFLIIDDASYSLDMPQYAYTPALSWFDALREKNKIKVFVGFEDVANAIHATLDRNPQFCHLFACGHNRVWMRTK